MKFSPYSYSKIDTFVQCPLKFKFNYIEHIKVFTENESLEKGSRVHQIIELFNPSKPETLPEFKYKLLSQEKIKEVETLALNFCKSELGQKYLLNDGKIGHEIEFGLSKQMKPVNYYSKDALLRGKIDFLIKNNEEVIVVDWKTGKLPTQEYHKSDQTMLYAIWCFEMFPDIDTIYSNYVFVEHNEVFKYTFKREYLSNYRKKFGQLIYDIETKEEFEKNVTKLCDWCDYKKKGYCNGVN